MKDKPYVVFHSNIVNKIKKLGFPYFSAEVEELDESNFNSDDSDFEVIQEEIDQVVSDGEDFEMIEENHFITEFEQGALDTSTTLDAFEKELQALQILKEILQTDPKINIYQEDINNINGIIKTNAYFNEIDKNIKMCL